MERVERDVMILQGEFIEKIYDGLNIESYLFKDVKHGWYSIKTVKKTPAQQQLEIGERCTVKARLAGNLKTNGTKVNCYNELTLEVYKAKEAATKI